MPVSTVAPGSSGDGLDSQSGDVELTYSEFPLSDEQRRRALILQILEDARRQGRRRRLAVSGPPVFVALIMASIGIVLFANADGVAPALVASAFLLVFGPVVLLFAILPTDVRLTALATAFLCAINLAGVADWTADRIVPAVWHFGRPACAARYIIASDFACATLTCCALVAVAVEAARSLLSAAGLPEFACRRPRDVQRPERTLQRLWELNGARLLILVVHRVATYAVAPASAHVSPADVGVGVGYVAAALALAAVCLRPSLRASARRWLMMRGESVSSAAGISMLFDSRFKHVDTAIASAVASLRGVRADRITPAALSGQMSQGAAFLLSQPAHVCGIDAFVCHSSRDPPALKWAALQSWRGQFVAQHKREPVVWLDRCCLDHSLRGVGLANLPVTIASCQSMVVLFGSTALSRLWCVVELFVHQHMGGSSLELVYLPGCLPPPVHTFDAWHSDCHLPEDRVWLLSCIETAAGTRAEFNAQMRSLLLAAQKCDEPPPSPPEAGRRYDHELHSVAVVPSIHAQPQPAQPAHAPAAPPPPAPPPPPPPPPAPPPTPPVRVRGACSSTRLALHRATVLEPMAAPSRKQPPPPASARGGPVHTHAQPPPLGRQAQTSSGGGVGAGTGGGFGCGRGGVLGTGLMFWRSHSTDAESTGRPVHNIARSAPLPPIEIGRPRHSGSSSNGAGSGRFAAYASAAGFSFGGAQWANGADRLFCARARAVLWAAVLTAAAAALVGTTARFGDAAARAECVRCSREHGMPARATELSAFGGARYVLVEARPLSFDDARAACAARGGSLVEIDGSAEDEYARCVGSAHTAVWIGLSTGAQAGAAWRWESGRAAEAPGAYINWVRNYTGPAQWVAGRRCAHLEGAGWSAADRPCHAQLPYICEFSPGDV